MARFRWGNIPIPEAHATLLVGSAVLHHWRPQPLLESPWLRRVLGWPALLAGILLATWAVVAARDMELGRPTKIVVDGPYAFSRNPMYVAWTLIYAATSVLVNTWWSPALLPALTLYTHFCVIGGEEKRLESHFGEKYREYRRRVRRYI